MNSQMKLTALLVVPLLLGIGCAPRPPAAGRPAARPEVSRRTCDDFVNDLKRLVEKKRQETLNSAGESVDKKLADDITKDIAKDLLYFSAGTNARLPAGFPPPSERTKLCGEYPNAGSVVYVTDLSQAEVVTYYDAALRAQGYGSLVKKNEEDLKYYREYSGDRETVFYSASKARPGGRGTTVNINLKGNVITVSVSG